MFASSVPDTGPRLRRVAPVAALAALLLLAACGKKGPPVAPEPRGPHPAAEPTARQIGDTVLVYFGVPQAKGDQPTRQLEAAELVRVDYVGTFDVPPDPAAFTRRGVIVGTLDAAALVSGQRVVLEDAELDSIPGRGRGMTLRYAVRLRDQRGRWSRPAVAPDLAPLDPGGQPQGLTAEPTADGVRLVWEALEPPPAEPAAADGNADAEPATQNSDGGDETDAVEMAPGDEEQTPGAADADEDAAPQLSEARSRYNVYRASSGEPFPERSLNQLPLYETEYLDAAVEVGLRYVYVVRAVVADGFPLRESESSLPVGVEARDTFAPAAPQGLVAVQEGLAVRLFWNPNSERDIKGYRIYRRLHPGPWVALGPGHVEQSTYVDGDVSVGRRLSYRVTAIDRAAETNESEPSEFVELEILAEPVAPGRQGR